MINSHLRQEEEKTPNHGKRQCNSPSFPQRQNRPVFRLSHHQGQVACHSHERWSICLVLFEFFIFSFFLTSKNKVTKRSWVVFKKFSRNLHSSVLDDLVRDRKRIIEELGDDAGEEVTEVTGAISRLKYEMQTDKSLSSFRGKDWVLVLCFRCFSLSLLF